MEVYKARVFRRNKILEEEEIEEEIEEEMKLIFLHGPPASGKFTVAKELSKITGYKLVHIHDFYDPLAEIFSEDNYYEIIEILNKTFLEIFEKGAKLKLKGMVFTYTEITKNNYKFPETIIRTLKKYKSEVNFVKLSCNKKELYKRISNESRKNTYKTNTKEEMDWMLKNKDYSKKVPNVETLEIDNTTLSPKKTALIIKKHFKL